MSKNRAYKLPKQPTYIRPFALPEPPRHPSDFPQPLIESVYAPRTLAEYVGQPEAKELAHIMVEAARKDRRTLPNTLVVGEYGLGKTTLARLLLDAYGAPLRMIDGASCNRTLPTGLTIVDEIHNITPETADTLNLSIDTNAVQIIGCTTDPGKLPSAFRSRFRILYLRPYTNEELAIMCQSIVRRKGVSASHKVLQLVAERSRFNARQATLHLSFIFDLMTIRNQKTMTDALVIEAFTKLGVDRKGFAERDRVYLSSLPDDRPVGLQYLAAVTGIDEKTLEEEIEPYLLRMGMIDRTQRGRMKIKSMESEYHGTVYR